MMAEIGVIDSRLEPKSGQALPQRGFDRMQELMRHGYVPDSLPPSDGGGLLLRHPDGPNLVIRSDGNLDVPLGQPIRPLQAFETASLPKPRRRWLRAMAIFIGIAAYLFLAVAITVGVFEGL